MIKKIAWNTFKNTGDVNTFLELKQIQNLEEQIGAKGQQVGQVEQQIGQQFVNQIDAQMGEQNGNNKNEWYNNFGK